MTTIGCKITEENRRRLRPECSIGEEKRWQVAPRDTIIVLAGCDQMNDKVYQAVKDGTSDNNINFHDFQNLIIDLGFRFERQRGSHETYRHPTLKEKMNIQPDGSKAKAYQVRQLRAIIKNHNM